MTDRELTSVKIPASANRFSGCGVCRMSVQFSGGARGRNIPDGACAGKDRRPPGARGNRPWRAGRHRGQAWLDCKRRTGDAPARGRAGPLARPAQGRPWAGRPGPSPTVATYGLCQGRAAAPRRRGVSGAPLFISYLLCKLYVDVFMQDQIPVIAPAGTAVRQNSPIPTLFLLIMTILLLSNISIEKKKKV